MESTVLEKSALFAGVPTEELNGILEEVPHHIQRYDKGDAVFHLMEDANRVGLILEGRVQAVSVRNPGSMIGPAAVFSRNHQYPCDVVALEPSVIMMFRGEDILLLLQKDLRIMRNFMAELATAAAMLQERLELLSYSGIAQKAAFYLLIHAQQSGKSSVRIPESVSNWAMIMNVSRSSLHRELKKLEDDGIIAYAPPVVEIRDEAALQDVLGK